MLHLTMNGDYEVEAVFNCSSGTGQVLPLMMIAAALCSFILRRSSD